MKHNILRDITVLMAICFAIGSAGAIEETRISLTQGILQLSLSISVIALLQAHNEKASELKRIRDQQKYLYMKNDRL